MATTATATTTTLPPHLFQADAGALFDVRVPNWHTSPPVRPVYRRHFAIIESVAELKATLRAGPYTWPGGYQLYFITSDGGALSFDSAREWFTDAIYAIKNEVNNG